MKAHYYTRTPEATFELGNKFGHLLKGGDVVLLKGDLGVGKTVFTQGLAVGLGVNIPVKSPTFAYVNSYPLRGGHMLYHYDLYRLDVGADVTSLGYEETIHAPRTVNIVEWADKLADNLPERYILVEIEALKGDRKIDIEYVDPSIYSDEVIESFYDEWATPIHVRSHCKQVANVATQIGMAYVQIGEPVNLSLLYASGRLHDLCRVCDFNNLDSDNFSEEITSEKWQKWESLRQMYKGRHHASIAHDFLLKKGFDELAETVRMHRSSLLAEEHDGFDTLEKKILYYADKRVKHDQIVSLEARFLDFKARYGSVNDEIATKLYAKVEKFTHALESELFAKLNIEPKDIR